MTSKHSLLTELTENQRLACAIDHTKLTFGPDEDETRAIETLCREARNEGFYAVCVRPRHITQAKALLKDSPVQIATVIGFPVDKVLLENELKKPTVGNFTTAEKVLETRQAVAAGADELDLVIHVGDLKQDVKAGGHQVRDELIAIRQAADGRPIKVIIEIDLLTEAEIIAVTRWCAETGMAMVKTSTGMVTGGRGATLQAVSLIAQTLKQFEAQTGIKASGGIKSRADALAFLEVGVNRLGTSSGVAIMRNDAEMGASASY